MEVDADSEGERKGSCLMNGDFGSVCEVIWMDNDLDVLDLLVRSILNYG